MYTVNLLELVYLIRNLNLFLIIYSLLYKSVDIVMCLSLLYYLTDMK